MAHKIDFDDPYRWLWYILHGEPRLLHMGWLKVALSRAAADQGLIDPRWDTNTCLILKPEELIALVVRMKAAPQERIDYYLAIATMELVE